MTFISIDWDSSQHRIKIKWNAKYTDEEKVYTEELLRKFLQKYGDIVALVFSTKKRGSALVEFRDRDSAEMAFDYEKGLMSNPLNLEWVGPPLQRSKNTTSSSNISNQDFESIVLRQMRQAEERKRIIEQMLKDDAAE